MKALLKFEEKQLQKGRCSGAVPALFPFGNAESSANLLVHFQSGVRKEDLTIGNEVELALTFSTAGVGSATISFEKSMLLVRRTRLMVKPTLAPPLLVNSDVGTS